MQKRFGSATNPVTASSVDDYASETNTVRAIDVYVTPGLGCRQVPNPVMRRLCCESALLGGKEAGIYTRDKPGKQPAAPDNTIDEDLAGVEL